MQTRTARYPAGVAIVFVALVTVTGCGNKDDAADKATTTAPGTSEAPSTTDASTTTMPDGQETALFDKEIQTQLIAVGCLSGSADGVIGPRTDAAILAFQRDSKLTTDGELGPATEQALAGAASSGRKVCAATTGSTTTAKPSTSTTFAANDAPCTATAITSGLGGDPGTKLASFRCSGSFAGGVVSGDPRGFIVKAQNGTWVAVDTTSVCNTDSAQIALAIKQLGCTGNGN